MGFFSQLLTSAVEMIIIFGVIVIGVITGKTLANKKKKKEKEND